MDSDIIKGSRDMSKTHFKKAFDSPYLSSADITGPTTLTISHVRLEENKAGRKDEKHNTAYFSEKEIREGEALKPMILNVVNSKTLKALTGSPFIDDWQDVRVSIYVDSSVKFGRDMVEGLRISTKPPKPAAPPVTPKQLDAIAALRQDGKLKPETIAWIESHDLNRVNAQKIIDSVTATDNVD
jgi:hypothetical protein